MGELSPEYRTVRGSDIGRDGMFLELMDSETARVVAEVFFSDTTQKMTLSIFQADLPLDVVELLIARAKLDLPPAPAAE
jgi:hypothetical protein